MSTPTLAQARRQRARQQSIVALGVKALRKLFATTPKPTVPQIAATGATYQTAAALASTSAIAAYAGDRTPLTIAQAFAGVSSLGFSLTEPIIATIDRRVPAPVEAMPAPWWDDAQAFMADLERLFASEIADAGRTASQVEFVARPDWQNYVRMLTLPSCKRCVGLAGRIYRDLDAFQRHPVCDCVMVPVQDWEAAHDEGLATTPEEALKRGGVTGLSHADAKAIEDGADFNAVVNATRGTRAPGITNAYTTTIHGHKVKATHEGTTKRAAWRKANPSRLVRLRPESIYQFAKDHDDAVRLLKLYGYIT